MVDIIIQGTEIKVTSNETLTIWPAGELRLGYPVSIIPEEITF